MDTTERRYSPPTTSSPLPSDSLLDKGQSPSPLSVTGLVLSRGDRQILTRLLSALPAEGNLCVVVATADSEGDPPLPFDPPNPPLSSLMVLLAEDGMDLRPDTVLMVPQGVAPTIDNGRLRLKPPGQGESPNRLIDHFFGSLAALGPRAAAVIPSGFEQAAAEGLAGIQEGGGTVVVVDDSSTAQTPPAKGGAYPICSTQAIADRLVEFAGRAAKLSPAAGLPAELHQQLNTLFTLLDRQTNHDFSSYKKNTVLRRIERRMAVHGSQTLVDYIALLETNPQEAHALSQDLLIGMTNFFRDPEAFDRLTRDIIPRLFADRDPATSVRIWHACCATGEEVYSVAMLLQEYLEQQQLEAKVQIFATDLDEKALAKARAGLYDHEVAGEVEEGRLHRFFARHEHGWQIRKELREMIVFARHNLIKDPPFSRIDLLVCRNFLIYVNPDLQKLLIPLFHQVLNPGGFLFLGSAETIGLHGNLFTAVDKKWKIFLRRGGKARTNAFFPLFDPDRPLTGLSGSANSTEAQEKAGIALAERHLMHRYVPAAHVVINDKNEVVNFSDRAGTYLQPPGGKPTLDLLKMAREELRPSLRVATYKAFTTQKEFSYRGIRITTTTGEALVNIIVVPLVEPPASGRMALVIFEPDRQERGPEPRSDHGDDMSRNSLIRQLEEQLRVTGEQLQSTNEQLEGSNERFMLANEELMTVNEELQSTNEELQSTNEELLTVNAELQKKMEELNQSNSDLENLFTSSQIATIFLDRQLVIKRFSPAMAAIFDLLPADLGRPFRHINDAIDWSELHLDAQSVLEKAQPIHREVRSLKDSRSFDMRVLPYRANGGAIDGIVVTLVDISERKQAEQALREGDERLRFALARCHIGAWDLDLVDQTAYRSQEHSRIFGYHEPPEHWTLETFIGHVLPEDRPQVEKTIRNGIAERSGWSFECRIRRVDGAIRWLWVAGRFNIDPAQNRHRVTGVVQDITDRKEAEEENHRLAKIVAQEKDRLTALFDSMADEVWFVGTDHRVTLTNPSAQRALGIEETGQLDLDSLMASRQAFRHDGSPRPVEEMPILRALRGEVVANEEELLRHPVTGELCYREVTANPVWDHDHRISGAVAVVRDISARRQAELAQREADTRFRLFMDNSPTIAWIKDQQGRYVYLSKTFEEHFQVHLDLWRGRTDAELWPKEVAEAFRASDQLVLETGEPVQLIEPTINPDGSRSSWLNSKFLLPDTDGNPLVAGIGMDITELKRKDEALRQSEQLYRSLFNNMLNGFAHCRMLYGENGEPLDFMYLNVNRAFETLTGLKNVVGRKVTEVIPGIRQADPEIFEIYGRVARTGRPERFEIHLDSLDMWFAVSVYRPEQDYFVAIFDVITERKQAEEQLRLSEERRSLALEASQAGTWEWLLATNENIWSKELWRLYGLTPDECRPSYAEWLKTIHSDHRREVERIIQQAVAEGVDFSVEWRVATRDGQERWLMSRGRPIKDSGGQIDRYAGIVIDITERRRVELEKKNLHAQLVQAQKMEALGTLAGGIAHDFNNILSAVLGYTELARDANLPRPAINRHLDKVMEAGARATNLVRQILAFSRQVEAENVPLDPVLLVKEAIRLLRPALPSTITFKQHLPGQTALILADPTRFQQILMNLCTNAFHAMEKAGGVLDISLEECRLEEGESLPAGRYLRLTVADTGSGIPPEHLDKIFNPYFTTKEIGRGTGLGLAIVHGIVTDLGGTISCESELGKGATFRILLPAVEEPAAGPVQPPAADLSGKGRILLVDDEEPLVKMGKILLERLGYRVTTHTSSLEAWSAFRRRPDGFDAVITDQTMPNLTGAELAGKMLELRPDLPVILCTGYSSIINEDQAKQLGIKGFAMKPVTKDGLAALLKKVLGQAEAS